MTDPTTQDLRTTTDRDLIRRLVDALTAHGPLPGAVPLWNEARAYLAQPEPEEPTDAEVTEWADAATEVPQEELDPEVHGWRRCFSEEEFANTIRSALDRWGK